MKIFSLIGVVIFVLFAIVQYNDPDPYVWIPAYLFAAYCMYSFYIGRVQLYLTGVGALLYLIFSIVTFPPDLLKWVLDELNNSSMSMKTPSMEEARESLGSLICFVFLSIGLAHHYLVKKRKEAF